MKRILVVHYSQSGQLTRMLDAILAPLHKGQHTPLDIVELALEPAEPFPFPWGFMQFLDAFSRIFSVAATATQALAGLRTRTF